MSQHVRRDVSAVGRERLSTVFWVLFALLMVLTLTPASWGFSGWPVVLHLTSFPLGFGVGLAVLSVFLGFRAVLGRGQFWQVRLIAALLIAVVAAGQASIVVRRGGWWSTGLPTKPGDVVILSFNSAGMDPIPTLLVDIIVKFKPDAIALPETNRGMSDKLAAAVADRGLDYQVFAAPTKSSPPSMTSLLVSTDLGEYQTDREISLSAGVIRAVPVDGNGPVIIGVHPQSPNVLGLNADSWQEAGRLAVAQCKATRGVIVAGDFNATLDHPQFSDLGRCRDVAAQAGQSAKGTWPAWLPSPLASAIDHVLVDGDRWEVVNYDTRRVGESDHRLVISTIRPK